MSEKTPKKKRVRANKRRLQHDMRVAGVKEFQYTGTLRSPMRYRPNEECPCGSKRKYKNCCMSVCRQSKTSALENIKCGWCSHAFKEGDKIAGFRLGKAYCSRACLQAERKKAADA